MIAYLDGKITYHSPTFVYIDIDGLGYHVNISLQTYSAIESLAEVKLWTYLHVKEDSQTLYGFFEQDERTVFRHLLSVSGIGPNTARLILSSMTSIEVRRAISQENVVAFNKVKGVGPKTAKRVILDLKDKIVKEELSGGVTPIENTSDVREEAIKALVALGFQRAQAQKSIDKYYSSELSVEELIKTVLQQVSR